MLAVGGAGFAIGNLLLARVLPPAEFGHVSLLLSLIQVGATFTVLGLPVLITRRGLKATGGLLGVSLCVGIVLACAVAWVAAQLYELRTPIVVLLAATILFAALARIAGALFQSVQKFGISLLLSQSQNWVLPASVPIVMILAQAYSATVLVAIFTGYVLTSAAGWVLAWRASSQHESSASVPIRLISAETLGATGHSLATSVFFQADRLLVAKALSLEELAIYAIVAAVAGSAFRMLQVGAGYSLVPRLRTVADRAQALVLLRREAAAVFALAAIAATAIAIIMPLIFDSLLQHRYDVPDGLVMAVVIVGLVRIWQAFAASVVSALGSGRQLLVMGAAGWVSLLISMLCALGARDLGLTVVIYGIGSGWLTYAVGASALAFTALKDLRSS